MTLLTLRAVRREELYDIADVRVEPELRTLAHILLLYRGSRMRNFKSEFHGKFTNISKWIDLISFDGSCIAQSNCPHYMDYFVDVSQIAG